MLLFFLTLIPTLLIILYTTYTQWRAKSITDALLIATGGFIVVFNALTVYGVFNGPASSGGLRSTQQVMSCMIVPIAYMYFARQMGRNWLNPTTINLWVMMLFLMLPSGYYFLDQVVPDMQNTTIRPMSIHLFLQGHEIYVMYIADIIILCQALLTLVRMYVMVQIYRRYHIRPSRNTRYFLYWWAACVVFIVFNSTYNAENLPHPAIIYIYYVFYSLLAISIFLLISCNLDLRPEMIKMDYNDRAYSPLSTYPDEKDGEHGSEDADSAAENAPVEVQREAASETHRHTNISGDNSPGVEKVDNVDNFLLQSVMIADRIKMMLADKERCLDANFTTDSVIRELGTNRTYFYRIVKAEFACSFNDLLLNVRMEHATSMLKSTDTSIHDIAIRCGFSDNNTFSRRFKQVYGVTPTQYRGGVENRQ